MKEMFVRNYCGGRENILPKDLDFIDRVFKKTLIRTCYINLPESRLFEQMTREIYTSYVKTTLLSLACEAAEQALIRACYRPDQVTHLVFGTMTATIRAPSLDISIIHKLKLRETVKRLNVEAMGCLTGFRLLGLCRDMAAEDEENVVLLVVCDIRSALGNQLTPFTFMKPIDKSNVIVSAMFRDSGGAAVLSQNRHNKNEFRFFDHQSFLVPNSFDKVLLQEFDAGKIHLFLDKTLPDSLFSHVPELISKFLCEHSVDSSRCLFAVHTGGPKIINGIQQSLGLRREQLFATWFVMENYGNLSGSSNLVVLDHIKYLTQSTDYDICTPNNLSQYSHIVGLSFGPGLGVECVLLQI
jgi:chalcone synthase